MTGPDLLLRGQIVHLLRRPDGPEDQGALFHESDGGILIRDGRIAACGVFADIRREAPDAKVIDHRPNLLLPGFIDPHLHFPQMQVIASFGTRLIEWLNRYTFPEEMRFTDPAHAARVAAALCDTLIAHGTTTAVAYCSSSPVSVDAYFGAAAERGMAMIGGKVMMDRNAPDGLIDTVQSSHDDSFTLARKWHGTGRLHYAITPRFAITSTPEQLEAARALVAELPDCYLQTHLGETPEEIAYTMSLYPDDTDYTGIYERFGLLGPKTLLGHCIHLTEREIGVIRDSRSVAVSCPTSNLFLGSGLFPQQDLVAAGVRTALATDIGGGTSYSMLQTMDAYYKVQQLRRTVIDPLTSFWLATRGNAEALGLEHEIGTLDVGTMADIVVLDPAATPAMALRHERAETLAETLFILQTMGDDRAVAETYVAGRPMKTERIGS